MNRLTLFKIAFLATLAVEVVDEAGSMVTLRVYRDGNATYDFYAAKADILSGNMAEHDDLIKTLKKEVKLKKPKDFTDFKLKIDKKPMVIEEGLTATANETLR